MASKTERRTGNNSFVLRKLLSANGERDREDGGHGDGNAADEEDEDVVETITVAVAETGIENEDLGDDEDAVRIPSNPYLRVAESAHPIETKQKAPIEARTFCR